MNFDDFRETRRFSGLDGLRAAAISLVIFHHLPPLPEPLVALQRNGVYGVALFFAISGFLISTLLFRERSRTGRIDLKGFFIRRSLRLFPLYYIVLLVVMAGVLHTGAFSNASRDLMKENFVNYVTYTSNWLVTAKEGPFFFSWSLATEEQFYLVFGLAAAFFRIPSIALIVAGALALKLGCAVAFGSAAFSGLAWRMLFSIQEALLWGVLLAIALHHRRFFDALRFVLGPWGLACCSALLATWFCLRNPDSASAMEEQLIFPLMALIVAGCASRAWVPVLDWAPLAWTGQVSYGMYLFHWFVLVALQRAMPQGSSLTLYGAIAFATTVALATLSFVFFERPIARLGRTAWDGAKSRSSQLPQSTSSIEPATSPPTRWPIATRGSRS